MTDVRNVVLVHGGFVDGSGWRGVYDAADGGRLQRERRAEPDALARERRRDHPQRARPAGRPGDPRRPLLRRRGDHRGRHATSASPASSTSRRSRPTQGESVNTLIADPRPARRCRRSCRPQDGFLFLDREKFADSFAADVPAPTAAFMADSQVPWGVEALNGDDQRARVAQQAELVPGRDRRPDDPAAGAAGHVRAGRRDRRRSGRQPLDLRLAARAPSPT